MPNDVTIRLFPGLPNPRFALTPAAETEALSRLETLPRADVAVAPRPAASGYHGIYLRADSGGQLREYVVFDGVVRGSGVLRLDPDRTYERWLFEEVRRPRLLPFAFEQLSARGEATNPIEGLAALGVPVACADALPLPPPPDSWHVYQQHNNCLNYALNIASTLYPADLGQLPHGRPPCEALVPRVEKMGAVHLPRGFPETCSNGAYLILMCLVNPSGTSGNYHFLRLGEGGVWSHKFGGDAVTDQDGSGAVMRDLADARFTYRLVACAVFENSSSQGLPVPL